MLRQQSYDIISALENSKKTPKFLLCIHHLHCTVYFEGLTSDLFPNSNLEYGHSSVLTVNAILFTCTLL